MAMKKNVQCFPLVYTQAPERSPRQKEALTPEQIQEFFSAGFLIVHNVIENELIEELKVEWEERADQLIEKLFQAGKIRDKHENIDFFHRMIKINEQSPGASVILHRQDYLGPNAQKLWSHTKVLDILEHLIGPEIAGNPVWNLRIKLPHHEPEVVPWHQDNGYFNEDAQGTMIATAWIPFMDTARHNGGMQVVRGTHKKGVLGDHHCCSGGTWYIEMDEDVIEETFECNIAQDAFECVVPKGSILFFSNALVHRSFPNPSEHIRWSMDLRWQNDVSQANEGFNDEVDEFDTRISGPWMKRWPIKHHNQHTELAGIQH
eukprot:maker-scaffold971_size75022-snap-gene-0.7 protein:Tk03043 transcript:maker-scaffold971_size75022-snap-gene-0.7-mRNA-1 annotation:"phytanoyl- dioxygenase domain-containing protein 1 homolog"